MTHKSDDHLVFSTPRRNVKPRTTRRVLLGTTRLIQDLTTFEQLTREQQTSARSLLEKRLGPETARLALAAATNTRLLRRPVLP
jgi:arsenate reductase-like glutaredoxin family protein